MRRDGYRQVLLRMSVYDKIARISEEDDRPMTQVISLAVELYEVYRRDQRQNVFTPAAQAEPTAAQPAT